MHRHTHPLPGGGTDAYRRRVPNHSCAVNRLCFNVLGGGAERKIRMKDSSLQSAESAGQLSTAVAIQSAANERKANVAQPICLLVASPFTVQN